MTDIFLKIINMSISAGWIVLAVLLLRVLLKKAPKWITVLFWGIVAVRLICPFSIESVFSLMPRTETISPTIMMDGTPEIDTGIPVINNTVNSVISDSFIPEPAASVHPLQIGISIFAMVWFVGMISMLTYTAISYWRLHRKVDTAVLLRDNIFQSENVTSPFVFGILKPRIYLPFGMREQDAEHVIAHEQAHIRRKDNWWKPLGFLLLALHWFNPLMWIGYALLCRDIEFACDERAIKDLNDEQKADYSQALLACSVNRRMITACPFAFGGLQVKRRVSSVLTYKKPAAMRVLAALLVCAVVAVCFLTDPKVGADTTLSATEPGNATEQNTEQTPMTPEQQNQQHLNGANSDANSDENAPSFDYEKMDEIFQYLRQSGMKLEDGTTVLVYQNTGVEAMVLTYKWIYTKYTSGPVSGESNEEGVFPEEVVGAEIGTIEIPAGETVYVYANEKLAALADSKRVALLSCSYGDLSVNLAG